MSGSNSSLVTLLQVQHNSDAYLEAVRLRRTVLRVPLGLDFTAAELNSENSDIHVVGLEGDQVVAALVISLLGPATFKIRQVCVDPDQQGKGIGRDLVDFSEKLIHREGGEAIVLHARETVLKFWETLGYEVDSESFLEVTIPHRKMVKHL